MALPDPGPIKESGRGPIRVLGEASAISPLFYRYEFSHSIFRRRPKMVIVLSCLRGKEFAEAQFQHHVRHDDLEKNAIRLIKLKMIMSLVPLIANLTINDSRSNIRAEELLICFDSHASPDDIDAAIRFINRSLRKHFKIDLFMI